MSGRVLVKPETRHHCGPGWTYRQITEASTRGEYGLPASTIGMSTAIPPTRYTHPPGTIWQCDCDRVWQAWRPAGADASGQIGRIWWRQLGRFALWRMRRRGRLSTDRSSATRGRPALPPSPRG